MDNFKYIAPDHIAEIDRCTGIINVLSEHVSNLVFDHEESGKPINTRLVIGLMDAIHQITWQQTTSLEFLNKVLKEDDLPPTVLKKPSVQEVKPC